MKAQVVSTFYPQLVEGGGRDLHAHGAVIDVTQEEFDRGVAIGALRKPSDSALPEPNVAAVEAEGSVPAATQPDGTPLDLPDVPADGDFRNASSHAEADALAASLGVTFPAKAKLDEKNEALRQVTAARADAAPGEEPVSDENLADLPDAELIQRGIDYGHTEDEMADKSHDELVLFVAEAMRLAGATEAEQRASVAEREANTDQE